MERRHKTIVVLTLTFLLNVSAFAWQSGSAGSSQNSSGQKSMLDSATITNIPSANPVQNAPSGTNTAPTPPSPTPTAAPFNNEATASTPSAAASNTNSADDADDKKKPPIVVDPNAPVKGPYQGHFFYLIPAYHVVELRLPFKPLTVGEKFEVFSRSTFDQKTIVFSLFNAGIDEATRGFEGYGGGGVGYGKRVGAEAAGIFTGNFLSGFFVPAIMHQDPRYFRKGYGTKSSRVWYALSRVVITRTDHGHPAFNFGEFAGVVGSSEFAQIYLPPGSRNTQQLAKGAFISIAEDAGINILREFGPEVHKKFRVKVPKDIPGSEKE